MRKEAIVGTALLLCIGCSGSSSNGGNSSSPITATVNGSAFVGNTGTIARYNNNALSISAFNANQSAEILITVTGVTGPGTYSFASSTGGTVAEYETMTTIAAPQWITGYNGGTGSITISSISATGAKGTFSFTGAAVPGTGATGTASVTGGAFDVSF